MATTKVTTGGITDATIATADIADDAVNNDKIANSAVNTLQLADSAVHTSKINDDAITTDKLANSIVNDINANSAKVQTTINNNGDNKVITGSGTANTLEAESTLTWNGTLLDINQSGTVDTGLKLRNSEGGLYVRANDDKTFIDTDQLIIRTEAEAERMRIDSSGRLLIGTTTEGHASADNLTINDSGNSGITIRSGSSDVGTILFSDDTSGAGEYAGYLDYAHTDDRMTFGTSGTERVRIDSSGNVGINDTSPTAELSVAATAPHIDLGVAGGTRMKIGYEGNNCFFGGTNANAMFIFKQGVDAEGHPQASGTERMRIDSSGGVRIGTTTYIRDSAAYEQASIKQTGQGHALTCEVDNVQGGFPIIYLSSTDDIASQNAITFLRIASGSTSVVGSITTTTSATSYNTSSDYRLKENEVPISDGITRLKTLKPYRFNWKIDPSTKVDGFFAHEVTAVPEAVIGTKDEVSTDENGAIPKGEPIYQSIDHSKLVPLLTAALQEAIAKIETLETKVAALEAG